MIKLIIAITLNTILFVASVGDLITTETQIISTLVLVITYLSCTNIKD